MKQPDFAKLTLPEAIAFAVNEWLDAQEAGIARQEQKTQTKAKKQDSGTKAISHESTDKLISEINKEDDLKKLNVRVERRGFRLCLRAKLPDKLVGDHWMVQRISIKCPATDEGVQDARSYASLLADQINKGSFRWADWSDPAFVQTILAKQNNELLF